MSRSTVTARQLNRTTLARQLLLRREPLDVVEAVRRIVLLQAQQPESPYLALWTRITDFDAADLDAAFADRSIVKASLIRITLHAVHAADYPAFHNAMVHILRASCLNDPRFTGTGLSIAEVDALVPGLLEFVQRTRTKAEMEQYIEARLGESKPRVWWALRRFAPLHHAPVGGPWSFGVKSSFVAARGSPGQEPADGSVQRLFLRYLEGFGPASAADFAGFTMLRRPAVTAALRGLEGRIVELEGPDGTTLFDVPGGQISADDTAVPPRLLPMWESILLAYADRSRVIQPEYRKLVTRNNGDVLATILVDGHVAGVWRTVEGGIEVTAFHPLSDQTWHGLAAEAASLVAFLATREPSIYRRYAHWFKDLPSAEVRVLPA